ncbi:MAG: class I SAM-dependent methyltransferase [Spirochaetales bacterium]|nr:class I SAM-dependent methyltransferase [Spirochaetales bacterium]
MKTYSSIPSNERIVDICCGVCGSSDRKNYWEYGGYAFSRCTSCGLIYQSSQPEQTDLFFRYDDKYFEYEISNEKPFFDLMLKTLSDLDFSNRTEELVGDNPEFLDVGCATGLLLEYMESLGWKGRGVEICTPAALYGKEKRGLDIFNGSLLNASYSKGQFSVIHSSHLIEHLTDPAEYIRETYRILKPGGLFITTTPNASSLQRWLFGRNWRSAIADHMFLFSVRTLSSLISSKGYTFVSFKTWGGLPAGLAPGVIKKPLDFLAKKFNFGDVCVILAQKPY